MIHPSVETSAAEGEPLQFKQWEPVWDQISLGKEMFSKCVQKYSSDYFWNINPLFFFLPFLFRTLSVGSDLKSSNIASSLILPILHLLLSVSLFLIYIYIFFSGFFFFSSFLTLQNERQNDGQLTIYIIIFLFLLSSGRT